MKSLQAKLSLKIKIPQINRPLSPLPQDSSTNECSYIVDNSYISGYKYSNDYCFLKNNNFTHIINCAGGSKCFTPCKFTDFKYHSIDLRDDSSSSIIEGILYFISLIQNIQQENQKNKILIHCAEGISRAPALVCSYLMWKKNIDSKTAINYIKQKRSCIDINIGFVFQLNSLRKDFFTKIQNSRQ